MLLLSNSPGGPQQVFLGNFTQESSFVPLDNLARLMDWGEDLSGAQTAYNAGPEVVMIAAVGNSECE